MDFASCIFKDHLYFGSFPSPIMWKELSEFGISLFIDLTSSVEKRIHKLYDYYRLENKKRYSFHYLNYPIPDNECPSDIYHFKSFLRHIIQIGFISAHPKIYIHCRGGHGRSGLLVAGLLCYLTNIEPQQAIQKITEAHRERKLLRHHWKSVECPKNKNQRQFIMFHFQPTYVSHVDHPLEEFLKKSFPRPMFMKEKDSPSFFMIDICLILRHLLLHSIYDKEGHRYIRLHYDDICNTKVAEINKSSSLA